MISEKVLKVLEFDKILEKIAFFASTKKAKEKISALRPFSTAAEIGSALSETREADIILHEYSVAPYLAFDDVSGCLERAEVLSMLSMGEILKVERLLRAARVLKGQILNVPDARITLLKTKASQIFDDKRLETDISTAILSDAEMSDNASPALRNIRNKIKKTGENIRNKLLSYVHNRSYAKYIQDNIITVRNDRYVVPLKAECKGMIPGLIHDQSASGATLYVEPMAIVELNNSLKTCIIEENSEIEKILRDFTAKIGEEAGLLKYTFELLTDFDIAFAKAAYADSAHGILPEFNEDGRIFLQKATHPLIDSKKAVANDLRLGDDFDILLVTGPNTGGKTVCLKMAGLFELMGMSGIFVPALHAELSFFDGIYADIGDEQSIEQNLSTFSSHIGNVVEIVDAIDDKSLVLLDELGAGTDPAEGASLALSITKFILKSGAKSIITTHFNELKEFAIIQTGVQNASFDFDPVSCSPTYKLTIGAPGASNALFIAEKLGLNREIIEDAKNGVDAEGQKFENLLRALEVTRRETEEKSAEAERLRKEAAEIFATAVREKEKWLDQRERLNLSVRKETKKLVEKSMEEADEIIAKMKTLLENPDEAAVFEANKLRKSLKKYAIEEDDDFSGTREEIDGDIETDDAVLVKSLNAEGTVVAVNRNKGSAKIRLGKMESIVRLDNLARLKKSIVKKMENPVTPGKTVLFDEQVSPELNIIGMTGDEALCRLEEYIDKCLRVGLREIKVIHGYGEGILRGVTRKFLNSRKEISGIRDGNFDEGLKGVTVATFK